MALGCVKNVEMQSVFWGLRCRVEQDAPQFYPSSTQELVVNLMSGAECNSSSPSEIVITGVRARWLGPTNDCEDGIFAAAEGSEKGPGSQCGYICISWD